jgi:hypothetical protein
MNRTKVYTSFADLKGVYTPNFKALTIRPVRRHYLSAADAVYDFTIGHDFVVRDDTSPFDGCIVSCLDKRTLKEHGYTDAILEYNNDMSVEIKL